MCSSLFAWGKAKTDFNPCGISRRADDLSDSTAEPENFPGTPGNWVGFSHLSSGKQPWHVPVRAEARGSGRAEKLQRASCHLPFARAIGFDEPLLLGDGER